MREIQVAAGRLPLRIKEEIGDVGMADTVDVVVPKRVHSDYIFREIIINFKQRRKFTLHNGIITKEVSDLQINFFGAPLSYKINFASAEFSDKYLIATAYEFEINNIFKHARNVAVVIAIKSIRQGMVAQKVFFIGFQNLFASNVVAVDAPNDE